MAFKYDGRGVEPSSRKGFQVIPKGTYILSVAKKTDTTSKNGDDQVIVNFTVKGGEYDGAFLPFYYVTFLPRSSKGAGMALHFLKCIGEPYEGEFEVESDNWLGKCVKGRVDIEEFNGNKQSKVVWVEPVEDAEQQELPTGKSAKKAAPPVEESGDAQEDPF